MHLDGKVVEIDEVLDVELEEFIHDCYALGRFEDAWHLSMWSSKYTFLLKAICPNVRNSHSKLRSSRRCSNQQESRSN